MEHDIYRQGCLNLQASENRMSPGANSVLGTDMAARYSHILPEGHNSYGGGRYMEQVLHQTEDNISRLYGARFSEVRPTGGHIAALTVITSMLSKGDTFLYVSGKNGGYPGYQQEFIPDMLGYRSIELPYDDENQSVRLDELENMLAQQLPALVILGQSAFVRPYDLKGISDVTSRFGVPIAYDGSHVMGLIAGGVFQQDVLKYCKVLYGSTHKSFFGPQGGIILTNDESLFMRTRRNTTWLTMDNYHPSRVAALGIAAEEMLKYGKEYARNLAENSKRLAEGLSALGWEIRFPPWYSFSHQVLISEEFYIKRSTTPLAVSMKLEENGIIVDRDARIGLSEVTRMGLSDMDGVARLMNAAISGNDVRQKVKDMVNSLSLKYGE
ncbi:MAG: serine hydroxymethyltransferase [Candidatus Thermoplasmatota archaeon]|nr:serine hydroxymethyltransferase [Candidatus Thermoplasmatota archaeon]